MLVVVEHPLVQHKLSLLRDVRTSTRSFRALTAEVGMLLAYECLRDAPLASCITQTPQGEASGSTLEGKKLVLVSVLRAGSGLLDGMLKILPSARVGHVGLYRDARLQTAVEYFCKFPSGMENRDAIIVGSVLASGATALAAIDRVLETGPRSVRFVCLVASQQGIDLCNKHHPDVPIVTAAVDPALSEEGMILPGLGDMGDRLFGTR